MGSELPKQFMLLHNKPVLYYPLKVFLDVYDDLEIILVLPEAHTGKGQEIIDAYFDKNRIHIAEGGDTRFQSVKNGLQLVGEESIVFVHDAARCLVSKELVMRCYEGAVAVGTAVPAVASKDSVRVLTEDGNEILERDKVMLVQTPQTFHSKIILPAFNSTEYKERFTDEASVVEYFGIKINLVQGDEKNIKITNPADLSLAAILQPGK